MEALQVAVMTAGTNSASNGAGTNHAADGPPLPARPSPTDDAMVRQCMGKLKEVESEFFDRNLEWRVEAQALEPADEEIEELREAKARAMDQLSRFLDTRAEERRDRLEAGLQCILSG